jgi:hypothetical protein
MSCRYSDFEGKCTTCDPGSCIEYPGIDEEGNCMCEDDPDPSEICEYYEDDEMDDE